MKREILSNLLSWKQSTDRKPLLLQGARQTGKTYILKELGKTHYTNLHYFNFETEPLLHSFLRWTLTHQELLNPSLFSEKHQ